MGFETPLFHTLLSLQFIIKQSLWDLKPSGAIANSLKKSYNKAVPMGFETVAVATDCACRDNNKAVPMGFETLQRTYTKYNF